MAGNFDSTTANGVFSWPDGILGHEARWDLKPKSNRLFILHILRCRDETSTTNHCLEVVFRSCHLTGGIVPIKEQGPSICAIFLFLTRCSLGFREKEAWQMGSQNFCSTSVSILNHLFLTACFQTRSQSQAIICQLPLWALHAKTQETMNRPLSWRICSSTFTQHFSQFLTMLTIK